MTHTSTTTAIALAAAAAALAAAIGYAFGRRSLGVEAEWAILRLEDAGLRAGADSGNPRTATAAFEKGNTKAAGIWECEPGGFPVSNRLSTETFYVLSGRGTITTSDGAKTDLAPRTFHTLPTGLNYRWDVTETLRKLYILTP
ncbi:hypothetical protein M885DRAFT_591417 [Pelagophyceae sp. CCMP2097]|nr:hypothetical protein M885DRAFT_591417 [Pelagophyceae sp. CCMP2097]